MRRLAATIAVEDHLKLKESIEEALEKVDIIEIRFDYLREEEIDASLQIASTVKDRAIFTCRSKDQGGKMEDEEKRIKILERLIDIKPWMIDIEYDTLLNHKYMVEDNVLVSWHNFLYTPSINILEKQMDNMRRFGKNIKMVTFANDIIDNRTILDLYNRINDDTRLVAFCMGELGMASRVLSLIYGSPFTYAALDKSIAAGQMKVDDMRAIIEKIRTDEVILNRVIHLIDEIISL